MLLAGASGSGEGQIDIWGLTNGRHLRQHRGGRGVGSLAFAAEGRSLIAGRPEGEFQLYDVASGRLVLNERFRSSFDWAEVAAHPRQPVFAVGSGESRQVTERDPLTGAARRTLGTGTEGTIGRLRYRFDGALSAMVERPPDFNDPTMWYSQPHRVLLWAPDGRQTTLDTVNQRFDYDMLWSPTGSWLALGLSRGISNDQRVAVSLWSGSSTARELANEPGMDMAGLAWSPDGRVLAAGIRQTYSRDGRFPGALRLYDVDTGLELARLPGFVEPAISPDGAMLIARGDGTLDSALHLFMVGTSGPPLTRLSLLWLQH
jgi:WD40 repeat protein